VTVLTAAPSQPATVERARHGARANRTPGVSVVEREQLESIAETGACSGGRASALPKHG